MIKYTIDKFGADASVENNYLGLVVTNMQILYIIWLILSFFVMGLGIYSLRLYFQDKDKRKLMYGLGLFFSSISFFQLGLGLVKYGTSSYYSDILFHWGATAYIILIFWVVIQQITKAKINTVFKLFLITNVISLLILSSNLLSDLLYGIFMGIGTLIVIFISILFIIKEKNVTSYLFLLSIITIYVASMILIQINSTIDVIYSYFSMFAYFVAYTFIALIFRISPIEGKDKTGIGSYFSLEEKLKTTSKELSETKETFKNLFDQMIDPVVIVNRRGQILEASIKFYENLKASKEDLIGKNLLTVPFLDTKTKKLLLKNIALRLAGKNIPIYEIIGYSKDGEPIPFEIHAGKIQYKGKPADMAVFRDLREQKKIEKTLHETELKYKTIFEKTGTAIGTFGDDGKIIMVNNEFEKLTGYTKDDVENKMYWYDFISEKDKKKMLEYHKQRSSKKGNPPSEYNCTLKHKLGKEKTIHINIGLIPETSLRIVSLIDITPLTRMQKKLENMNKTLEEKVNQRTEEIQQLLKQKDEFIHQLGHDLKNPLGPMINLLPIIEKRETDPKKKEMIEVVNRNVEYMKNLVVKTIELAQLNSPNTKFNLEKISLTDTISEIISTNQLLFENNKVEVINNIKSNIIIRADRLRIQELFNNLFTNAVKYSKKNGSILIEDSLKEAEVIISIQDTGIGMTKDQMQHIFDEFYKADSSRHDFNSSGLGMAISKRIVEKHGGRIWVESNGLEQGSTFLVSFPTTKNEDKCIQNISIDEEVDRIITKNQ